MVTNNNKRGQTNSTATQNTIGNNKSKKENKNKKNNNNENKKATRNMTRMAILTSFMNVVGTCPYTILYILQNAGASVRISNDVNNVIYILLFGYPGLNIFIYILYNKLYRDVLVGYFKKIINIFN